MMKAFTVFSYKQPVQGNKVRTGVVRGVRDTHKHPVDNRYYRANDPEFQRSRNLITVDTRKEGPKAFYQERVNWKFSIPFLGSVLQFFGLYK